MPISGDYEQTARQLYAAVRPVAAHAFPEAEADRLAAVATLRTALEAAYLDGQTAANLRLFPAFGVSGPDWPAGDPFPGREAALLTPGSGL